MSFLPPKNNCTVAYCSNQNELQLTANHSLRNFSCLTNSSLDSKRWRKPYDKIDPSMSETYRESRKGFRILCFKLFFVFLFFTDLPPCIYEMYFILCTVMGKDKKIYIHSIFCYLDSPWTIITVPSIFSVGSYKQFQHLYWRKLLQTSMKIKCPNVDQLFPGPGCWNTT